MAEKRHVKSNSKLSGLLLSVFLGICSLGILILIAGNILVKQDINPEIIKYFWIAIAAISGLFTGLFAGKFIKSRGIIWGSITALILSAILFTVVAIANNFNIGVFSFVLIPITVIFGAIGGIISSNLR